MSNGNPYFNPSTLENLDLPDYFADTPDIEQLMKGHLNIDPDATYQYPDEGSPMWDSLAEFYEANFGWDPSHLLPGSNLAGTTIEGSELWDDTTGKEFLAEIQPYDTWREGLDKKSTLSAIKSLGADISATQRTGARKTSEIQTAVGRTGLAGFGAGDTLMGAHLSDTSRAIGGLKGNINREVLQYEKTVAKSRSDYVDEL